MSRIYKTLPGGKVKRISGAFGGDFVHGNLDDDYYDLLHAFRDSYGLDDIHAYLNGTMEDDEDEIAELEDDDFTSRGEFAVVMVHGDGGLVFASFERLS
jgi:hypothetical protein